MNVTHLVIDVREACRAIRPGKGQWTYGFTEELLKKSFSLTLLSDSPLPKEWKLDAHKHTVKIFPVRGFRWHVQVARWLRAQQNITMVSPTSYIVPALLGSSVPSIPVVHDLIAFRGEPHDRKAVLTEHVFLRRATTKSAAIATVSEATKQDLLTRYPQLKEKHIAVIGAGPLQEHAPRSVPDGKTILCVGTLCPRKNQKRLIEAYAQLQEKIRTQFSLVLVGARGWNDEDIVQLAKTTPGVEWKQYVPNEEYASLLSHATVLAHPSLYEGFGMQVLDALQRGIPVLTSHEGSLKEVAGSACVTVDPQSVSSIATGLEQLLTSEELRNTLSKQGPVQAQQFSWKRTVERFSELLKE